MKIVDLGQGKSVSLYSLEQYESHCNKYFKKNRNKLKNLLSEDIPEGFINRQLNDSRYISKLVKGLLSNLVRENNERETTSKHLIPVTGSITSKLKQDWGLNDKWNELLTPRFERLNKLVTKEGESLSKNFGYWENQNGKKFFRTQVPDEISKGFNKKRIDHRHHALDALVIACCTREHTHYLNALNAENKNYGLRNSLLQKSDNGDYTKHFLMPWDNFTTNAKSQLEKTVVSFKQNLRVINKTNNKTWQWKEKDGKLKKQLVPQIKGDSRSIRKPMHKETVSGKVFIDEYKSISIHKALENHTLIIDKTIRDVISLKKKDFRKDFKNKELIAYFKDNPLEKNGKKISKVKVWTEATATRTTLSDKFTRKQLESITDTGIQIILENHIKNYIDEKGKEQFDLAFNPEGVEELNKNIVKINNGKKHQPIYRVRLYEVGSKFNVGLKGNRKSKFVEAAKGTNLFFAIYWNEEKKTRVYETIPLNEVIAHQKWRATLDKEERNNTPMIPVKLQNGQFLFSLSPNDLVYVPTDEENDNIQNIDFSNLSKEQVLRLFVVNDFSSTCYFTPSSHAKSIAPKEIDMNFDEKKNKIVGSYDDKTASFEGKQIKERCWKLKVDRLGNIKKLKFGEY
jgi:CRISPR-associated endonuclease Csn1